MKKQLKSFKLKTFAWVSVVLLLVPPAVTLPINILVFKHSLSPNFFVYALVMIVGYILTIPVHEGLHALAAIVFGKISPKNIKFGMVKEQMMFYCHCDGYMEAYRYRAMLLTPFFLTGLFPLIAVTIWGHPLLIVLFSMSISGCAGDIVMYFETFKYNRNQLIEDHPSVPAYYLVYGDDDILPEDFHEVTEEEEKALIDSIKKK